jgi:hypothetical protein
MSFFSLFKSFSANEKKKLKNHENHADQFVKVKNKDRQVILYIT